MSPSSPVAPGARALGVASAAWLTLACALPFSIAITEGALVLGLSALLVARAQGRAFTFARSALDWGALAIVAAWLLATAFSPEPLASLINARKLYALGLVVLTAEVARAPRVRAAFVPLVLAGATLTALVGFAIFAVKIQREPDYRLQSLLSNQMTSGGVLAAAALWGLGALTAGAWRRRLACAAALLPIGAALALTQTRSHWLGALAGAVVILIVRAPRAWWTIPLGAAIGGLVAPRRLLARLASIVDPHEPGNQGRLSMWRSGLDIIRERPWTGAGCQDLLALYRRHRYPDATFESGHFHNNVVQFAVMSGIPGLAAFLLWTIAGAERLVRAAHAAGGDDRALAASALAVFAAMHVGGMFDFTFGDAEVVYHSFIALGLALAILPGRTSAGAVGPGAGHAGAGA